MNDSGRSAVNQADEFFRPMFEARAGGFVKIVAFHQDEDHQRFFHLI